MWEVVSGLEVHAQLSTQSKLFSGAATVFGAEPNTQACAVDLGFPGVLPVLNADVVNMAIRLGLGIQAEIGREITRMLHTYQNGNSVDLHFFAVDRYENELRNRIFREIRWVDRSELPALDFLDADKELVRQLAAGELL